MAEWRIGRGWSDPELEERLEDIQRLDRNFSGPLDVRAHPPDWNQYYSEAVIATGASGPPEEDGPFARGRVAVANYEFSDPRIVIAHFAPDSPLRGRRIILEMRALRAFHYLSGVVVTDVRSEKQDGKTTFGFRYDTLEGHIEAGAEWFLLTKDHATGEIRFRIEAAWRPGQFPNWWSRVGFSVLGPFYQKLWHHRAHALMMQLTRDPSVHTPQLDGGKLVHSPPDIIFKRYYATNV